MIIRADETKEKRVGPMSIREYPCDEYYSGARIHINGHHGALRCLREDRMYFVIDGEGSFSVDGQKRNVSKEDMIYIPRNTPYDFSGNMSLLLICSPAFDPADDVSLEEDG